MSAEVIDLVSLDPAEDASPCEAGVPEVADGKANENLAPAAVPAAVTPVGGPPRRGRKCARVYAGLRALPAQNIYNKLPSKDVLTAFCEKEHIEYDVAVKYLKTQEAAARKKKRAERDQALAAAAGGGGGDRDELGRPNKLPRTPDAVDVGTKLAGREVVRLPNSPAYALLRELGKGGFGTAYESEVVPAAAAGAADAPPPPVPTANTRVCVKLEPCVDKKGVRKGEPLDWDAMRKLAGIPGVPHLFATGTHTDSGRGRAPHFATVMTLLGESLHSARQRRHGGFGLPQVALWAMQGLETLRRAHARGLLHRDVKPENILLGSYMSESEAQRAAITAAPLGRLYFCDWGLASKSERSYRAAFPGSVTGTAGYASVHAHMGRAPAPRDDLESFAYCLAYALRGRLPWSFPGKANDSKADRIAYTKLCRSMMGVSAEDLFAAADEKPFRQFAQAAFLLPFDSSELPYAALSELFAPLAAAAPGAPPQGPSRSLELPESLRKPGKGRCGNMSHGWMLLFRAGPSMKQRYHSHVVANNVTKHMTKAWDDGLWLTVGATCDATASGGNFSLCFVVDEKPEWGLKPIKPERQAVNVSRNTLSSNMLPAEWIEKKWTAGFLITEVCGNKHGDSLVVMTKLMQAGMPRNWDFSQRYRMHEDFPYDWISEKKALGYSVTTVAPFGSRFLVVVSKLPSSWKQEQICEMDFCYPSEPMHRMWEAGYRIRSLAANRDTMGIVMESGRGESGESTERRPGTDFPGHVLKKHWESQEYLRGMTYGRITC